MVTGRAERRVDVLIDRLAARSPGEIDRRPPILVVGAPRSGTTWTGVALGLTAGAAYVHEPDKEPFGLALRAKRDLGRYPVLEPGEPAPLYESLWRRAFDGDVPTDILARARRSIRFRASRRLLSAPLVDAWLRDRSRPQPVRLRGGALLAPPVRADTHAERTVVKSVHAVFAVEWIEAVCRPHVLVVVRHPLDVLASWKSLGWLGSPKPIGWPEPDLTGAESVLGRHPGIHQRFLRRWDVPSPDGRWSVIRIAAWHIGLLTGALQEMAEGHPTWRAVVHEQLCQSPAERFRALADDLGLMWTRAAEDFLHRRPRPGQAFDVQRVTAALPNRWRDRLTRAEVEEAMDALRQFPLRIEDGWDWPHPQPRP